jgi:uncharacterized membrane protein
VSIRVKKWLLYYAFAGIIFALFDGLWIISVARHQYENHLGHLLAPEPNFSGAIAFYFIYIAGIVHYGIRPNNPELSLRKKVASAALFGLFTYATWALTALTIFRDFPTIIAITDILWGTCISGFVTWLVLVLSGHLNKKRHRSQMTN